MAIITPPAEVVIELLGVRPLARLLDLNPSTVTRWREKGTVPQQYWDEIIQITEGRVTLEELHKGRVDDGNL